MESRMNLDKIPVMPVSNDPIEDQLINLMNVASRLGLFQAWDWMAVAVQESAVGTAVLRGL